MWPHMLRAGPFRSKVAATAVWVIHTQPTAANRQPYHQKPSIKPFLHLTSAFHHFDLNRIIDNNFDLFYLINTLKGPDLHPYYAENRTTVQFLKKLC